MTSIKLYQGNCLDVLKKCPDNFVDSIVTDPPYGLSFMGKAWDYDVPTTEIWKECLRVLKPGGHLLAFGGTRTYHRLVVNIEDAGFEIRDQIMWIYGSGFPKSMDISKAIDKEAGAEREVLGAAVRVDGRVPANEKSQDMNEDGLTHGGGVDTANRFITAPATEDAKRWSGWGTALKPANEPICLARKPLSEKTVAKNVLKHGVGGLNVDGSRIGTDTIRVQHTIGDKYEKFKGEGAATFSHETTHTGRFPANILFDEAAAAVLDEQSGISKSSVRPPTGKQMFSASGNAMHESSTLDTTVRGHVDSGGASRFFYVAKASKKDRGEGNIHPTVKPIKLMEYLVKLVTPEGGVVLDPFMGSGTTGVAAKNLGFGFRGVEMTPEYFQIAQSRICKEEEGVA